MPLDFLDKDVNADDKSAPAQVVASEPVAPVEPAATDTPQPVEPAARVEPQAPQVPPGYIPIAAQLDERDKRQRIEREFEEFRRNVEAQRATEQEKLDPLLDPEGFEAAVNERIAQATWTAITTTTRSIASRHYGEDVVKAAESWVESEVQNNPTLRQAIRQQSDPYDFVVREHKRRENMAKYGDVDPDTYGKTWAEKNGYVLANAVPNAPLVQPAVLPRASIASAASAGSNAPRIPIGNGVAHERLFDK